MAMEDELKDMLNIYDGNMTYEDGDGDGDKPATNAPGTESPTTEAPFEPEEEEDVATDAPSTDAPGTDSPATEAPEEPSETDKLKAEIEELKSKLDKPSTDAPSTPSPTTEPPIEDVDYVGENDPYEMVQSKEDLNKLLNRIRKEAIEYARKEDRRSSETVLRGIPDIVKHNITTITTLKQMTEQFYNDNSDLKPYQKVVGGVFQELQSANPEMGYQELLPKVADETRNRLKLQKKAQKSNPPKLPRKKGQQRPKRQPSGDGLVDEISEMNKVIGGN